MNALVTNVRDIPAIGHDEAMRLAATEYDRLIDVAERLSADEWARPTECTDWQVKAIFAHVLGMLKFTSSKAETGRQFGLASEGKQRNGGQWIDSLTAVQVRDNIDLPPQQLVEELRQYAPAAVAGRANTTEEERAANFPHDYPNELPWTRGYLLDIVLNRDPWMHRIDICRATGAELILTPDHDGRIVADVVADWARRHGQPCTLVLEGSAGASYVNGDAGPAITVDAVDFCRILSGRGAGERLLATQVPF